MKLLSWRASVVDAQTSACGCHEDYLALGVHAPGSDCFERRLISLECAGGEAPRVTVPRPRGPVQGRGSAVVHTFEELLRRSS